jgi:glycerophosphoryl diester phosphodiesterase
MLIFAHRGASGDYPENTLAAIQAALAMHVDGIEIDIYEVENELVVFHDRYLDRTTSGKGLLIEHTFDYIRTLDAGNGEKIPTLAEVLACVAGKCIVNIELKAINNLSLLYHCLSKAVADYNFSVQQLLISSFNHQLLTKVKQQHPHYRLGALTASCPLEYACFAQQLSAYSLHVDADVVNQAFVIDAHQRHLKVFVYTIDNVEDIVWLNELAIDGIFTNYPQKFINAITPPTNSD